MVIHWFRRDLRLDDNTALLAAHASGEEVLPFFLFDTNILDKLHAANDARVTFIHDSLAAIQLQLESWGSSLHVAIGEPVAEWEKLLTRYGVTAVYANRDYEPYAVKRDQAVKQLLEQRGIPFYTFKDHVLAEPHEVLKDNGEPYTVFTPYSRKWKNRLPQLLCSSRDLLKPRWFPFAMPLPGLSLIGFARSPLVAQPFNIDADLISNYAEQRDLPALRATSRLGVHLRFGTVSIRRVYQRVAPLSDVFVNELIWREFYQMIVWHFPHCETRAFKPAYDRIEWLNREDDFVRWKEGQTGYPLVDAGMRQLAATGWMHNRVRMVVASFLTKHLLVDWRWGEAWFAEKLLDFELASNNGGWQWAAGSGCDAAPYFRVFNPTLQQQRFDPQGLYVSEWVPGLDLPGYPQPMVSHPFARQRAVGHYKKFVGSLV